MTVFVSPTPKQKFFDNSGAPLAGGKLFIYGAGTTTKVNSYTDSTGGTPNVNPIILDSRGEANVWLAPGTAYKYTLSPSTDTDPPTNPIYTVDQLTAQGSVLFNSANYSSSDNYGGTSASAGIIEVLGSSGTPSSNQDAVAIIQKWSNSSTNYSAGINPALYVSNIMSNGSSTSRGVAGYFEGQTNATGSSGNFTEGVRAHGTIHAGVAGGAVYGVIAVAGEGAGASHFGYLVGCEAEVDNNSADATYSFGTGNSTVNHFEACFLATSGGSKKPFAFFMVNPFISAAQSAQVGFHVPAAQPNVTSAPVVGAAFRSDAPSTWGLDLTGHGAGPTFGSVGIPNNIPIRANNQAGSGTPAILHLDTTNRVAVGNDSGVAGIIVGASSGDLQFGGTGMFIANGSVATAMSNLGPAGSHTTIQEWLTFKNPGGTVRYVPCF